jgi:hypothetical protein
LFFADLCGVTIAFSKQKANNYFGVKVFFCRSKTINLWEHFARLPFSYQKDWAHTFIIHKGQVKLMWWALFIACTRTFK